MKTPDDVDENIDLAYTYTGDSLKHLYKIVDNLRSRVATLLGFGGVLLRFIIELSDSQPSYKLTKILAFLTCFVAVSLLGRALMANNNKTLDSEYINSIKDNTNIILRETSKSSKRQFIKAYIDAIEVYFTTAYKIRRLLNIGTICLVFSAFFFTVNGVLLTCLGK